MSLTINPLMLGAGQQRDPGYQDIYANQLRVSMTQLDFSLIFGATEDYGPNVIGVRDRLAIRVSPSMLKFIVLTLQNAMGAYEEAVGAIPFPENLETVINTSKAKLIEAIRQQQPTNVTRGRNP